MTGRPGWVQRQVDLAAPADAGPVPSRGRLRRWLRDRQLAAQGRRRLAALRATPLVGLRAHDLTEEETAALTDLPDSARGAQEACAMELRPVFDGLVAAAAALCHGSRPCPACTVFAPLLEEMQVLIGKWEGRV